MKVGLEKEFFLIKNGKPQSLATDTLHNFGHLPCDECGWLVEARGKPHNSIVEAVFSLKADIYQIEKRVEKIPAEHIDGVAYSYTLNDEPVMKVDRATKLQCARRFAKGTIKYQNLYGHECHRNALSEATAGVHVSFTVERIYTSNNNTYTYNVNFDWPQIFIKLDKAFADEIKAAKRRPGFYEIKHDGRVEYRSLPSKVDLDKLIDVLGPLMGF